ncbi:hypothetical protein JW979_04220, partial [bacterium]|nr:hypothetical protein [candidate division CSSED10-310 bacterium]
MRPRYIFSINEKKSHHLGNKAEMLGLLAGKKYLVPDAVVCSWDAYTLYGRDRQVILTDLKKELAPLIRIDTSYAIRSSANLEDEALHSFAGQFSSVLNVQGMEATIQAIQTVWDSVSSTGLETYLAKYGKVPGDIKMAVIIQEMISAKYSGVAFSKNPMTGLDEIVIEAVQGSGENLMQKGVTPDRWIFKWGDWTSKPDASDLSDEIVSRVALQTKSIAKDFGMPVDLEWIYDGTSVYWVQLREITAINDIDIYSNRIAKEVLPGQIKPLVWSINVPLVNSAWIRLFTELIGKNDIDPLDLSKAFYYRA